MYDPAFASAVEKKLLLVFVLSDIVHTCGPRRTEEETIAMDGVTVFMPRFVTTALAYQPLASVEKASEASTPIPVCPATTPTPCSQPSSCHLPHTSPHL